MVVIVAVVVIAVVVAVVVVVVVVVVIEVVVIGRPKLNSPKSRILGNSPKFSKILQTFSKVPSVILESVEILQNSPNSPKSPDHAEFPFPGSSSR